MAIPALEPRERRLLEGLRLNPRKQFAGSVRGERMTARKGLSIEFADYREYSDGDDLRHLDWNVLARLESPVMKTYRDEQDLAIYLLVDASASMDFGKPSKFEEARKLAAAFASVALGGGDAVYAISLGEKKRPIAPCRGRSSYHRLTQWLSSLEPSGERELAAELRAFASTNARPGLVILLSDGMDPEAPRSLKALSARGHEVLFANILSAVEMDPDLEGDLRLVDSEGPSAVEITANSYALKEYRVRLNRHLDELREATRRGGGRYALYSTSEGLETFFNGPMRRDAWVTT